jgi:hypothetical protein
MHRRLAFALTVAATIVAIGVSFERQTESASNMADVQGSGTSGKIAKWTAFDSISDSAISEDSSGRIFIGYSNPNTRLNVTTSAAAVSASAIVGSNSGPGRGIEASSAGGIGLNAIGIIGVNGITPSTNPNDAAIRGVAQFGPGTAKAGYFHGDVRVTGTLIKSAGSFRIDHPLDPENKFLSHSFVESPDMMNIYNGNVTTNDRGEAVVFLPGYFEALNRDFRYQLTVVGQFAQAIVLEKVRGNRFMIKTDKPNVEVSWQVTGIRQDRFAEENRIQVETDKSKEEKRDR